MKQTKDLMLTDLAEMIQTFYQDADKVGTTDALIKVIDRAYNTGLEHGKANA